MSVKDIEARLKKKIEAIWNLEGHPKTEPFRLLIEAGGRVLF